MSSLIRYRGGIAPFQQELNQLFDRFFTGWERPFDEETAPASYFPPSNVSETDDHLMVTTELPGVEPKDVEITVQDNVLTIKGEKRQETESKGENMQRVERSYGSFCRSFRLPVNIETGKVAADYKNGVLRVTLPKAAESKRRQVKISVA